MKLWTRLLGLIRGDAACSNAFEEAVDMLEASRGMFRDAVLSLHGSIDGNGSGNSPVRPLVAEIFERDRQINKAERSVRRKLLTHLTVSATPNPTTALVLAGIAVDIERIGDYTKNITELSFSLDGPLDSGPLNDSVHELETKVERMFELVVPAIEDSNENLAREIINLHGHVSPLVERHLMDLKRGRVLADRSGAAVITALHLRFLKRVSAHLKNIATTVVNPYPRIGFREKSTTGH